MNARINNNFNIRKGTMNFILEQVIEDEQGREQFIIIGYYKTLDRLYNKLAAGRRLVVVKYSDLKQNPKNGIYKTSNDTYVIVDGAKIAHSPSSRSIKDDELLETVEIEKKEQ